MDTIAVKIDRRCEDSVYVKLISSDKHEFIIKHKHALLSVAIEAILSKQVDTNEVKFGIISGAVLKNVCEYLDFKAERSMEEMPNSYICLETLLSAELWDLSN
uniref:Elongin-C n=1 Tax=Strigamia maritima TaxID=126957 RepID=T1J324_STRMM